jgi:hypothetical protein
MKHTKGPWENHKWNSDEHQISALGGTIALVSHSHTLVSEEESDANARLIAAAPEMLNNLKEILKSLVACEMVDASGCEGVSELWIGWIREIIIEAEGK